MWEMDLQRRMGLARPEDTLRGMFFNTTLQAIGSEGGEALVKRCLQACESEGFVEFFSYSVVSFLQVISTALPELAPQHGGGEQVLRLLGRRAVAVFMESVAGRALRVLAQGDVKRLVSNMPGAYKVAASFGFHEVLWLEPKRGRFVARHDFMPYPFHEGVMEAMIEQVGARNPQAKGRSTGPLDCEVEFSWE
jgi:uncharacterized protein (TIGR02265 family)